MSEQFLKDAGWSDAALAALPGDASTRTYARLTRPGQSAMLLRQPQKAESPAASVQASEAERRALGYNAIARLAGADCGRFAAVARYLRQRGLAAPQILAADFPQGLILIEDFGDDLFADVLADGGAEEKTLYQAAVEVLAQLHKEDAPAELPGGFALHAYDDVALLAEIDLLTEWFLPLALGRSATDGESAEHRRLWRAALESIAGGRRVFVHRDYHAQNLFWMPGREGLGRVGLIDFQDAVAGSPAYDLVSLIEDARRDVAPELAEMATRHYLATMGDVDEARFRQEMAVMAAQRNAKIVGIFARLFKRDGKDRYLAYLPRVWSYLDRDLTHPSLADLRQWYDRTIPQEVRHLPQVQKEVA
jgi:aminoglycoside/choline kinase family phosphotransferase